MILNPLECLKAKRDEIAKEYIRVLGVGYDNKNIQKMDKEFQAIKIKEIIDQYELTIEILKAMNEYEYLNEKEIN